MKKFFLILFLFSITNICFATKKTFKASNIQLPNVTNALKKAPQKTYTYQSKCGVTWECNNCQEYTVVQWVAVTVILDALCDFPTIDEIDIIFP